MFFFIFTLLIINFLVIYKNKINIPIKSILIISLIVRLVITFAFVNSSSEDLVSFIKDGQVILNRSSTYPTLYFPFFPYLGALAITLNKFIPSLTFLKLVFTLFDVINICLIYQLTKKNLNTALLYGLNPITIICANIHGQFDVIPITFLLLGLYLFNQRKQALSLLSLSISIFTKTWPALFIFPLIREVKKKPLILLIGLVPLISVIFHTFYFKTSLVDIFLPIKNYRGVYGYWGIGNLLYLLWPKLDPSIIQILRRLFFIGLFIYFFIPRHKNIINNILNIMLFFFTFTITFGSQWLSWILPLIILVKPKHWVFFITSSSIYLIVAFAKNVYPTITESNQLFLIGEYVTGLITWISVIMMFIKTTQSSKRFSYNQ